MNIAFIGFGKVGAPIAGRLAQAGHRVTLATDDPGSPSASAALAKHPGLLTAPVERAVSEADVVFLAIPFGGLEPLLASWRDALSGKILVDCTNPVGPGLTHGLGSTESGASMIQRLAPQARVVKAFSIYGFENLEDPTFPQSDVRPTMLYCGDDTDAKAKVGEFIEACGFEPLDVGGLRQALHLEHMTLLWVTMVRADGHSPHLVWAALRR